MSSTINVQSPARQQSLARIGADDATLLVSYIQAHIKKGAAAEERASQNRDKAEQHFITAGKYLIKLKATHTRNWDEWVALLKDRVGLSTSRASELMGLADGRKDLQQIRAEKAESVRQLRARSSLQSTCSEGKKSVIERISDAHTHAMVSAGVKLHAHALILDLINPEVRKEALRLVHTGECQDRYDVFRNAVAELYQELMKR